MYRWRSAFACLTFVAVTLGCASASPPPGTVIAPTDVRSLAGTWMGTLVDDRNMGAPLEVVIRPDATYHARFGATSANGTVALRGGRLEFTMTSGTGLLGPAESASTAVLYDRGGRRALVGSGRFGFRERAFSWEVTEQR